MFGTPRFVTSPEPGFYGERRLLFQNERGSLAYALFSIILASWDQHCSSSYSFPTLTSATTGPFAFQRIIRSSRLMLQQS